MKCIKCGRPESLHVSGLCPMGLHVVIDADTLKRARATGHPRSLKRLLDKQPSEVFSGVDILKISETL